MKDFRGPLSIKTVLRGTVGWRLDRREIQVDAVTTCCAFFQRGFVERIAQDATTPLALSLDAPERPAPALPFLSRFHYGGPILEHVHSLAPRCADELRPSGFEQDFLLLAGAVLRLYIEVQERIARVPAARRSNKEELFRRVERAREFIHAQTGGRFRWPKLRAPHACRPFTFIARSPRRTNRRRTSM